MIDTVGVFDSLNFIKKKNESDTPVANFDTMA